MSVESCKMTTEGIKWQHTNTKLPRRDTKQLQGDKKTSSKRCATTTKRNKKDNMEVTWITTTEVQDNHKKKKQRWTHTLVQIQQCHVDLAPIKRWDEGTLTRLFPGGPLPDSPSIAILYTPPPTLCCVPLILLVTPGAVPLDLTPGVSDPDQLDLLTSDVHLKIRQNNYYFILYYITFLKNLSRIKTPVKKKSVWGHLLVAFTSSRPVMEYACPFTRPVLVLASDSAELVIWRKPGPPQTG